MDAPCSFKEFYLKLRKKNPAKEFIEEIAALTHKSPKTVQQWLTGKQHPDALTVSVIARHLDIPPQVLFPELLV